MTNTPSNQGIEVVTVTLNPAIDRTVTISNFEAGKVNRVEDSQSDPGGKGVNVASFLADYGHRVAVTGFLGRGNAELFESLFERKGIQDCFVRIAGETRVGIKIADPVQRRTTDINFPGQAPAPADVDALFRQLERLEGKWFVLAGSIPRGLDTTIYRDLVQTLKAQGLKVVLDTSEEGLHHAVEALPQVIKPNIHELEALVGKPLETQAAIVQAAQTLLERGIQLVAVSMGRDGALFVTEQSVVAARPPSIDAKSTVGAGDAMVAGIVAGQLRDAPLPTCARLGTAFAVDAISHIGSGLSSAEIIEAYMRQVAIEERSREVG
ncbi:MAG: 1-phosphofructokinase [Chloroflexota bacterium]|nr:1-phosphofructokinase [Chloroflexota bacterium]